MAPVARRRVPDRARKDLCPYRPEMGEIVELLLVGGLHHRHARQAAQPVHPAFFNDRNGRPLWGDSCSTGDRASPPYRRVPDRFPKQILF